MLYLLASDTCFGLAASLADADAYAELYTLKGRPADKQIALLVPDFEWLTNHTELTTEQIAYLQSYPKPFSIVAKSAYLQQKFEELQLFNREIYQDFSLRVAHTPAQSELIDQVGPLFFTSANSSGAGEIYRIEDLDQVFLPYLQSQKVQKF